MAHIGLIMLVFSFVFSCLASCGIPGPVYGRWHLGWIAFTFFIASLIFGNISPLWR